MIKSHFARPLKFGQKLLLKLLPLMLFHLKLLAIVRLNALIRLNRDVSLRAILPFGLSDDRLLVN